MRPEAVLAQSDPAAPVFIPTIEPQAKVSRAIDGDTLDLRSDEISESSGVARFGQICDVVGNDLG